MKKLIFAIVIATLSVPAHGQEPSGQGNFLQRLGDTIRNIPRGGKPELTDDPNCRSYPPLPRPDAYLSCPGFNWKPLERPPRRLLMCHSAIRKRSHVLAPTTR